MDIEFKWNDELWRSASSAPVKVNGSSSQDRGYKLQPLRVLLRIYMAARNRGFAQRFMVDRSRYLEGKKVDNERRIFTFAGTLLRKSSGTTTTTDHRGAFTC